MVGSAVGTELNVVDGVTDITATVGSIVGTNDGRLDRAVVGSDVGN